MRNTLFGIAFAALALLACGGSSSSSTGPSGPTADQACTDLAHARCTKLASCSQVAIQARYGDEATCESREKSSCLNSLAAPSTGATPQTFEACVTAFSSWACADYLNNVTPDACRAQQGQLAAGAACAFNGQCQSAFCSVPTNATCGTCAAAPKAGDSCAQTTSCGPGLQCTNDTMQCEAAAAAGAACGKGVPCGDGLACVGATATVQGKCETAPSTQGAACDPKDMTAASCSRSAGFFCDTQSKQCVAITFASAGQACGNISGVQVLCGGAGFCQRAQGQASGTCVAAAADGAACDTANGPTCISPSRCVISSGTAGTCHAADALSCQ
jgi:hypothetical protein